MKKFYWILLSMLIVFIACKKKENDSTSNTIVNRTYNGFNITLRWAVHVKHYDKNGNLLASRDENSNYETGHVASTQIGKTMTGTLRWPSSGTVSVTINPNNTVSFTLTNCTGNYYAGVTTLNCTINGIPLNARTPGIDDWFAGDSYPYVYSFNEVYSSDSDNYTFERFEDEVLDGGVQVMLTYSE